MSDVRVYDEGKISTDNYLEADVSGSALFVSVTMTINGGSKTVDLSKEDAMKFGAELCALAGQIREAEKRW